MLEVQGVTAYSDEAEGNTNCVASDAGRHTKKRGTPFDAPEIAMVNERGENRYALQFFSPVSTHNLYREYYNPGLTFFQVISGFFLNRRGL